MTRWSDAGFEAYGGREIKHTGDGIMASFDRVQNSVRAAADIQRRFAAYNADASETLSVRIGIDAGEPVEDHNDLFGSTVQLASRLCSEAEANGIIVSRIRARAVPGGGCDAIRGARRTAIQGFCR